MPRRAAICIGVNRAGSMTPLRAAVQGARDFGAWATAQGCDTDLLVDEGRRRISVGDVFDVVNARVDSGTYEQLIVYFAGHGILAAPGVEYWLLSRAPENPNEAVNLFRSIEDARNCGIPHTVFVSDACRSAAGGPPLNGVSGATIFPNLGYRPTSGEIDIFYATRPGDPAWELPHVQATGSYRGIFTELLLETVKAPPADLVDRLIAPVALEVITARRLKPHLESSVPIRAGDIDVRIRQTPEVRPGTALPQYFAAVDPTSIQRGLHAVSGDARVKPSLDAAITAMRATEFEPAATLPSPNDVSLAARIGLTAKMAHLQSARGRSRFETRTGFSLHGARPIEAMATGCRVDLAFQDGDAWHWRFHPGTSRSPSSTMLVFESGGVVRGTVLAVLPEFIGTVVVDEAGRVISVNYVPSQNSSRWAAYQKRAPEIEKMKAFAAVAARLGVFEVPQDTATEFADRIRENKSLEPTLGLYAAYAYAQVGRYEDAHSVFRYMGRSGYPVPFDVAMLAARFDPASAGHACVAPFAPMLSQGWALLAPGDPMWRPIHQALRSHLVPSLWMTLTEKGVAVTKQFLRPGEAS